ncbi:MAG: HEPN domain-containing protein [Firmicutes bacterium]|nr:HEPN domain-containing protein [Bacillota bacterium]
MINPDKQVVYWKEGAQEDWEAANELMENGRIRQALFFVHLSMEKLIKAHVSRNTRDLPPRTHNLVRLADLTGIPFTKDQLEILAEINSFSLEGRYPESFSPPPTISEAKAYFAKAQEVFTWLMNQL